MLCTYKHTKSDQNTETEGPLRTQGDVYTILALGLGEGMRCLSRDHMWVPLSHPAASFSLVTFTATSHSVCCIAYNMHIYVGRYFNQSLLTYGTVLSQENVMLMTYVIEMFDRGLERWLRTHTSRPEDPHHVAHNHL